MSTINETVETALRNRGLQQYVGQARPVIDTLVQREQEIAKALIDAAVDNGLDRATAVHVFEGTGMHLPQPEDAPEPEDVGSALTRINSTLEKLTTFAKANGFRG